MTTNQLLNLIDEYAYRQEDVAHTTDAIEPRNKARATVVAALDAQATEIERLQREVVNRNQRALDGDLAVKVRDAEFLVNDKLREQIAALTKDAARYHWLREHTMPKPLPMVRVQVMYQGQYILRDGPELDADVDNRIAAIAAQKEQI